MAAPWPLTLCLLLCFLELAKGFSAGLESDDHSVLVQLSKDRTLSKKTDDGASVEQEDGAAVLVEEGDAEAVEEAEEDEETAGVEDEGTEADEDEDTEAVEEDEDDKTVQEEDGAQTFEDLDDTEDEDDEPEDWPAAMDEGMLDPVIDDEPEEEEDNQDMKYYRPKCYWKKGFYDKKVHVVLDKVSVKSCKKACSKVHDCEGFLYSKKKMKKHKGCTLILDKMEQIPFVECLRPTTTTSTHD